MWASLRDRLRQREPILWVAGVVFLGLMASAWIVEALEHLFSA